MTLKSFVIPAAAAAIFALGALPARADSREHGDHARARGEVARARAQDQRADPGPRADVRVFAVPRAERVAPRLEQPARPYVAAPRAYAVPRSYAVPRYYAAPRYYYPAPRYYPVPRYYASPRIFIARPSYPGFNASFGIFFGTPFPYRWAYPVYVPAPYGYPAYSVPAGVPYGGISFGGLTPYDASVFVDGTYVGVASSFDGTQQPLT